MKPKNLLSQNPICFDCQKELKKPYKTMQVIKEFTQKIDGKDVTFPKGTAFCKCKDCYDKEPRFLPQECEVYARIVGYVRPVKQWNVGKAEEYQDRKMYKLDK